LLRAGVVAAAVYNANPFRGSGARTVHAEDFVPDTEAQREPTEEEKLEGFKQFFAAMNEAADIRKMREAKAGTT
jgi:hypothetical protein